MTINETTSDIPKNDKTNVIYEDRAAMRAFLQRSEVRLSTIHRIAGIFLTGAGLLLLLPVFITGTFTTIFKNIMQLPDNYIIFFMFIILSSTLLIPLYSIYLLFKDIVQFYFTADHPGFDNTIFHPRFILSGIALSNDEVSDNKRKVLLSQLTTDMIHFILPFHTKEKEYFEKIKKKTPNIIPPTRRIPPAGRYEQSKSLIDEDLINELVKNESNKKQLLDNIDLFHVIFGLSGVMDRELAEEVAKMEASLVRHVFYLRRLILRYVKAFLMLIWTTLVLSLVAAIITTETSNKYSELILSIGFLFWALFLPRIVKSPIKWIYQLTSHDTNQKSIQRDEQLVHFERVVVGSTVLIFWITSSIVTFQISLISNIEIYKLIFPLVIICSIYTLYWMRDIGIKIIDYNQG
jgi:hypothetical protein